MNTCAAASLHGSRGGHVAEATFPLSLLPGDVLPFVLSYCSPKDACRLACVSKDWQAAAQSDRAWCLNAPWLCQEKFKSHFPELAEAQSNCEAFGKAAVGVHSRDKKWLLRADPSTGCVSLLASAVKNLRITWLDGKGRYWESQQSVPGSDFETCACLNTVCWFHLAGELRPEFLLPAGKYKMNWKVAKAPGAFRWQEEPALCSVTLDESKGLPVLVTQEKEVPLAQYGEPYEPIVASVPKQGELRQWTAEQKLAWQGGHDPPELTQGRSTGHGVQSKGVKQNLGFFHSARNFLQGSWLASRGGAAAARGSVAEGPLGAPGASSLPPQMHRAALVDVVHVGGDNGREEECCEELDDDDSEFKSDEEEEHFEAFVGSRLPSRIAASRRYCVIDRWGPRSGCTSRSWPHPIDVHFLPSHALIGREALKWESHEVVSFSLEGQEPRKAAALDLKVELTELRSPWWKSGLYVDAVVLTQVAEEL